MKELHPPSEHRKTESFIGGVTSKTRENGVTADPDRIPGRCFSHNQTSFITHQINQKHQGKACQIMCRTQRLARPPSVCPFDKEQAY
jgi:hypothetical protein